MKKSFLFVICIILCVVVSANAQMPNIDSTLSTIQSMPDDTNKVINYIDLANEIHRDYSDKAIVIAQKVISLSNKIKFENGKIWAYTVMGKTYMWQKKHDKAIEYYNISLEIAKKNKNLRSQQLNYYYIASAYSFIDKFDIAIENFNKSIATARLLNDSAGVIHATDELLYIYLNQKKYAFVDSAANSMLPFLKKRNDSLALNFTYSLLGYNALGATNYIKAVYYFKENLKYIRNDELRMHVAYINLAHALVSSGDKKNVDNYLSKSRAYFTNVKDSCQLVECFIVLYKLNKMNKNYPDCIQALDSASYYYNHCAHITSNNLIDIKNYYASTYEEMGDYKKANFFLKQLHSLSDSVKDAFNQEKIISIQNLLQTKDKEARVIFLNQENKLKDIEIQKRKKINLLIIIVTALLIVVVILFYIRYKNKKQTEKIIAEKEILKLEQQLLVSQMNPHFIFNSLNSIRNFVLKSDTLNADKYLTDFAKLIRLILESSRKEFIPLSNEIKILDYYLKLERLRNNQKFDYEITTENDENDLYDITIPSMLLQPFVENAIIHGVSDIAYKGSITINIKINNNTIEVTITDNGIGYGKNTTSEKTKEHNSLATIITQERISSFEKKYNKQIKLNIVNLQDIDTLKTGTQIRILIPIIYDSK